MGAKNKVLAAAAILSLALSFLIALADPPTPHSVAGYIFTKDGINQVPLGTTFEINDTNSGAYIRSVTLLPVPGMSGRYFATISGVNGDILKIQSWNATHYGNRSAILYDSMDNLNIYLNNTRNPEANVTIIYPANNSVANTSVYFNVTANITLVGANGTACFATINFSDESAFVLGAGESAIHDLGFFNLTNHNITIWNLSAARYGIHNITVSARCSEKNVVLERLDIAWANISINDVTSPIVRLMAPMNNSLSRTSSIFFAFNVTETAEIANCSLIINNGINVSNTTAVMKDVLQTLQATISTGYYNWSVNCTDVFGNMGASGDYNLTVNVSGPIISQLFITSPIALQSAAQALATCNVTLMLADLSKEIEIINATLHDSSQADSLSPDDSNNHYSNTSCALTGKDGVAENYSRSFMMWYYANNATWICNISAMDNDNLTGTGNISSYVSELVSFGVNSSIVDYGRLNVTNISGIQNITMYNFGNKNLNVSVKGYATSESDQLAMSCETGSIPVSLERYSIDNSAAFAEMTNLSSSPQMIMNFTLFQRTNDLVHDKDMNRTYWRIMVPAPAASNCSGVINLLASKA